MNYLAIELSTASAKAMLYATDRGILSVRSVPFGTEAYNGATQDAELVFAALTRAVAAVREENEVKVEAIGLSTTWHSLLLLDADRQPLDRIVTWANAGTSRTVAYRRDEAFAESYYRRTGCMVNNTYPFWQYVHLGDTRPELVAQTAYLSSQQEFLFERLTGEIVASTCTASGSGFLNIEKLEWDAESLEFSGARPEMFAPLKEPTYSAPLAAGIAALWDLEPGIPVVLGGADGALNQIGDGALAEGIMTFSVGTSGALRLASDRVVLPEKPATWCYYLAEGKRIVGGSTAGAGNCLTWFADKMGVGGRLDFRALDRAAEAVDAFGAPFFLPFPYGERCPGWRDERRAGFLEISGEHGLADLYYSVLEGVLFNLYQCYTILTELMPEPTRILVSGGITRSRQWLQMAADIFGKELTVSDVEHVSLLGAIAVARKAIEDDYDLGSRSNSTGVAVLPDRSASSAYAERFTAYLRHYEQN